MTRSAVRPGVAAGVAVSLAAAVLMLSVLPDSASAQARRFWESVYLEAREAEHYDSLEAMRDAADAVVVGQITSIAEGRVFGDPPEDIVRYVTATVAVEEVLSGDLVQSGPSEFQLEIMVPGSATVEELVQATPDTRSVFFLRHKASELARLGAPPEIIAADQLYYRLVILRGVVWEAEGRAQTIITDEPDFLSDMNAREMAAVIRAIIP